MAALIPKLGRFCQRCVFSNFQIKLLQAVNGTSAATYNLNGALLMENIFLGVAGTKNMWMLIVVVERLYSQHIHLALN